MRAVCGVDIPLSIVLPSNDELRCVHVQYMFVLRRDEIAFSSFNRKATHNKVEPKAAAKHLPPVVLNQPKLSSCDEFWDANALRDKLAETKSQCNKSTCAIKGSVMLTDERDNTSHGHSHDCEWAFVYGV